MTDLFERIQPKPQAYRFLRLREIKPSGWLREQLSHDLQQGFVGHLDELVPSLIQHDDIYGADRLTKAARAKELGVIANESRWAVQFLWWNSETQSNWLDGMARAAVLLDQPQFLAKARGRIEHLLATQDADGYLGIYAPDLRFNFSGENGELWAQASLLRVLLGWYEATGEARVLAAVRRAVDVTMSAYPIGQSHPFAVQGDYAGVGHGLIFTDVLDQLYHLTGDERYLDYALFLYQEYSRQPLSQDDIQLAHLLDPAYRFKAHGVHTYEHLRSLLIAVYAADDPRMDAALAACLAKLEICLTPSGGPIGDENIAEITDYPFDLGITFRFSVAQPVEFTISLRKPAWANGCALTGVEDHTESDGWIHILRMWTSGDQLTVRFAADVECHPWANDEGFITYGPLLFALPLQGAARAGRDYGPGFQDRYYDPVAPGPDLALPGSPIFSLEQKRFDPSHPWDSLTLRGNLLDSSGGEARPVRLIPLGGSVLRRVTFPRLSTGGPT